MPSVADLEDAFRVYFDEIGRCKAARCGWALLHLVVVLPDVCAALESSDGETTSHRYRDWCVRYLPQTVLLPEDRYEMRCVLLHQGRTLPTRGRYASFSFVQPGAALGNVHQAVVPEDRNITLDVHQMADEMANAIRKWFADLQTSTRLQERQYVQQHLRPLARVQPKVLPGIEFQFYVTSST